jgi:uncharacterized membrane protein YccC
MRPVAGDIMSVTTAPTPRHFAGVPFASWAFGIRVWVAVVVALYAGFWLELESASSAAITVGIVAVPTRGQALEKAGFRFIGTVIGVVASIALVGSLSQERDLFFLAFAAWVGLCIYVAALTDGFRAYGAVLSGYTVALVAIWQINTPQHVFDFGMQRGAAIALGIAAIAIVNDLLVAPDRHLELAAQLAALHRRVRDHARAVIRGEPTDSAATAGLLRETAALRAEITSLATESSSGPAWSAAARSTAVALVAEIHAVRVLTALPIDVDPAIRDRMTSALEEGGDERRWTGDLAASLGWAFGELLRRDQDVREGLAALRSGARPARTWRTPFYFCHRLAAEAGVRAALWVALASACFVLAGWPGAELSLVQLTAFIGLGMITPNPRAFTAVALIACPIGAILAGVLDFVILDGVTDFPQLALALAPFMIGAGALASLSNPLLAGLGRLNLIVILVVSQLSNPQSYNAEAFLELALLVCLAPAVLLAVQLLIPPVSDERRRRQLMASARREIDQLSSSRAERYAPEEAMFRDAARIGQLAGAGAPGPQHQVVLGEALALFDQAAMIRLCDASLRGWTGGPLASLTDQARRALVRRDIQSIRRAASAIQEAAPEDARARATSGALQVASLVMEGKGP